MQEAIDLVDELKAQKKKISLAESCTGGLIAKEITDVPGASNVFECGIVSYSNDIKNKVLSVDEKLLNAKGAVNEETAKEMAQGVLKLSGSDISLSVTGVAGPGPDGEHREGEIYIGLATKGDQKVLKLETGTVNQRDLNRQLATKTALKFALDYLKEGKGIG